MRVAIYCIIGQHRGQDTENQLAELRRHALEKRCQVCLFVDRDSGNTTNRAEFKKLFEAAARREFQIVLVWALDRFVHESVVETFVNVQKLLRYGVQFVSYTEPHFRTTDRAGELMIAIAAWIAKQDRIRISERTKAGLERARARGRRGGRPWKAFSTDQAVKLRQQGLSWRNVGQQMGLPESTIRGVLKLRDKRGGAAPQPAIEPNMHSTNML